MKQHDKYGIWIIAICGIIALYYFEKSEDNEAIPENFAVLGILVLSTLFILWWHPILKKQIRDRNKDGTIGKFVAGLLLYIALITIVASFLGTYGIGLALAMPTLIIVRDYRRKVLQKSTMKIFKPNTEIFETKTDKETVLKKMKQIGAFVIYDSFVFIGIVCGISGYIKVEGQIAKIHLKSELNGGLKVFGFFWIGGTTSGFIYGLYKIYNENVFDWLPIISLMLLVLWIFTLNFFYKIESESIKDGIKAKFTKKGRVREI